MNKYLSHFFHSSHAACYYIKTALTKKEERLWIFGAWKGTSYNDNTRYLYEYVVAHHPEIEAIWITKSKAVLEYLRELNYPVLFYPSKEAAAKIAHARYLFQTEGYRDTGDYPVGGATVIQLWHGIPCKAFNWFEHYSILQKIMIRLETGNKKRFMWISNSDFYTRFFTRVYQIPQDHFIKCGFPRCDKTVIEKESRLIDQIKNDGYKYVGLYLPTHRNWGKDFDNTYITRGLRLLDRKLEGQGICILFKPHPNEVNLFKAEGSDFKNIRLLDGTSVNEADVYQYLYKCDFLITDYSSVMYDFLITNKPIILFPYDLNRYETGDSGLVKEYFEIPVGRIVGNWEELGLSLKRILDNDEFEEKRKIANEYFNEYNVTSNSALLINLLLGKNDN